MSAGIVTETSARSAGAVFSFGEFIKNSLSLFLVANLHFFFFFFVVSIKWASCLGAKHDHIYKPVFYLYKTRGQSKAEGDWFKNSVPLFNPKVVWGVTWFCDFEPLKKKNRNFRGKRSSNLLIYTKKVKDKTQVFPLDHTALTKVWICWTEIHSPPPPTRGIKDTISISLTIVLNKVGLRAPAAVICAVLLIIFFVWVSEDHIARLNVIPRQYCSRPNSRARIINHLANSLHAEVKPRCFFSSRSHNQ